MEIPHVKFSGGLSMSASQVCPETCFVHDKNVMNAALSVNHYTSLIQRCTPKGGSDVAFVRWFRYIGPVIMNVHCINCRHRKVLFRFLVPKYNQSY